MRSRLRPRTKTSALRTALLALAAALGWAVDRILRRGKVRR